MKKNILSLILLSSSFLLASCGNNIEETPADSLLDFEDKTVSIEVGSRYEPDMTSVTSSTGKTYVLNQDFFITATDAEGESIKITNGSFAVKNLSGYTVHYRAYDGASYRERTVTVDVFDGTVPNVQIRNWRSVREVGTIPLPDIRVTDNSGEDIKATYELVEKTSGKASSGARIEGSEAIFTEPGTYSFIAKAVDSQGNEGVGVKDIRITPSMGENVFEDFASQENMETVRASDWYTSQTKTKWLETFEGHSGVAEIMPNYKERWFHSAFVQLGFNKTEDEMLACPFDNIILRMYVDAGNEELVSVTHGTYSFGSIRTKEWVDFAIPSRLYLTEHVFSSIDERSSKAERYAAFASSVIGDNPMKTFSINTNAADTPVKIYLDEVAWTRAEEDIEAPKVTLQGASYRVKSHTAMKLPTVVVSDNIDPISTYDAIHFYEVLETGLREIEIVSNTVQIGAAGQYKLVVSVSDFSGNHADREFFFTALDELDIHEIATFDHEYEIGGVSGDVSFLSSFEGASGVMKSVVSTTNSDGAGYLGVQFGADAIQTAIANAFDYIRFRVYVEAPKASTSSLGFYSWIRKFGDIPLNTWVDFDVTVKDLANGSFLSYTSQLTRQETYTKFLHAHVYNMNTLMYTNDRGLINAKAPVTFYFDSIVWGKTYEGTWIESIEGLKASYDLAKETSIDVPTKVSVSDGICGETKDATSIVFEKKNGATFERIEPVDGKIVFAGAGEYRATATYPGCEPFVHSFVVEDLTGAIYAYSSELFYEEDPTGGLWYPAKGQHHGFNYHNGGSKWLAKFEGQDGVTEYGVEKSEGATAELRFDIGNKPFAWDYVTVRIYFEIATVDKIRVVSGYSPIAQEDTAIPANTWSTMTITREMLATPGAKMYKNGLTSNGVDKFDEDCFGAAGYNNQNCFNFDLYEDGTANLIQPTVYISLIASGVNA